MKRWLRIVLVSVLCTAFALVALAAPKKKGGEAPAKSREKSSRSHRDRGSKHDKTDKTDKKATVDAGPAAAARAREVGDAGAPSSGVKESKQTDAGSSYKFGELEIEGRLKTPQIVYFLRRVRAEFAAQDLGHRSFQGELRETRKEPSF